MGACWLATAGLCHLGRGGPEATGHVSANSTVTLDKGTCEPPADQVRHWAAGVSLPWRPESVAADARTAPALGRRLLGLLAHEIVAEGRVQEPRVTLPRPLPS
jgi:hypothetical protein